MHDRDKEACAAGRVAERDVYRAFARMTSRLKSHSGVTVSPALEQLEELQKGADQYTLSKEIIQ